MASADERVDVVDEDDRVVGQATRTEMRRKNLLHRAVYILVRDRAGRLFVHRRTTSKDVYPGYWDVTVGGVVGAGEEYETAAHRELAEEIGVVCEALEPLFPVRYADASTRLLGRAFLARHDGPLVLQAEEIAEGAFVPLEEAERVMRDEPCCPDGVAVLRRYLTTI
jgi:isopentenyldiphosphate isomerase